MLKIILLFVLISSIFYSIPYINNKFGNKLYLEYRINQTISGKNFDLNISCRLYVPCSKLIFMDRNWESNDRPVIQTLYINKTMISILLILNDKYTSYHTFPFRGNIIYSNNSINWTMSNEVYINPYIYHSINLNISLCIFGKKFFKHFICFEIKYSNTTIIYEYPYFHSNYIADFLDFNNINYSLLIYHIGPFRGTYDLRDPPIKSFSILNNSNINKDIILIYITLITISILNIINIKTYGGSLLILNLILLFGIVIYFYIFN